MPSTNGHGPTKAILYARVSTDEQARSGYSLAQQLEALREYAAREGLQVLEEVSDPAQSGASLERPGMDRVRDLVAAGDVSVVLAQDRDRFAREPAYLYILKEEFEARGTVLRALNQRGDGSPEGDLTDGVLDQFSKYEKAKLMERTRRGKLKRAREGKVVPIHPAHYGFRFTPDREGYEIDPKAMPVVRRIFRMIGAEGASLYSVAKTLEREGIPSPTGRARWDRGFFRRLVLDDAYKPHTHEEIAALVSPDVAHRLNERARYGVYYYNQRRKKRRRVSTVGPDGSRRYRDRTTQHERPRSEWIAVPVPDAGIDRETVERARARVSANERPVSRGYRTWELSGIVRCSECGRVMYTNVASSRGRCYYRCPTRRDGGAHACAGTNTRADKIEASAWEAVKGILSHPDELRDDLNRMIDMKRRALRTGDAKREIDRWLAKIAEVDYKRAKFQHAYAEDAITLEDLKKRNAELDELLDASQAELERLRGAQEEIARLERDRDALLASYEDASEEALDSLTPEERHNLYKARGVEVLAHPDGGVEIVLGDLLSSQAGVCTAQPRLAPWR
jgi:site-specific DNA recombinase